MSEPPAGTEPVRLQKLLAAAGVGSRRHCEDLIAAGRVSVDGSVITALGTKVDPTSATVVVDGSRIPTSPDLVYLALNKPRGMVSTMSDPQGRPCVGDLVSERRDRLFHVGRLDADTEGLLLLTNDGELANRLSHPRYGVPKTYLADVHGPVARDVGRRLRAGIELDDGPVTVSSFRLISSTARQAMVEVVLHEGRKHVVRRLLAAVDLPVQRLVRTEIGPIRLGTLRAGRTRRLSPGEVTQLYTAVGQ
ncbi:MAG: pseudouridine synthase [Frankiaceae bacterium]